MKPSIHFYKKVEGWHWYIANDGTTWHMICTSFDYVARALKERLKNA